MVNNLLLILTIGLIVLTAKVFCNIFSKAGFPWYYGLVIFLPVLNVLGLLILAFSDWPVHKQTFR